MTMRIVLALTLFMPSVTARAQENADLPPCGRSVAADVNDAGWIVGSTWISGVGDRAVAWVGDSVIRLGALASDGRSEALAVDERGRVVGVSQGSDRKEHGFLWENGRMIDLAPIARAVGIGASGTILGQLQSAGPEKEAVLWDDGEVRALESLGVKHVEPRAYNTRGQAVGGALVRVSGTALLHAFLWEEGRMRDLTPGRLNSVALDVSDGGRVVGTVQAGPVKYHAFLWEDGELHDLGDFGGRSASAVAVDDHGRILVNVDVREGEPPVVKRALLVDGEEVVDLGRLREDYAGTDARAMNGVGVVVGESGGRAFVWRDGAMRALPWPVACREAEPGPTRGQPVVPKLPGDTDGDGVGDPDDLCPYTPEGATADTNGCPLDTDNDGVWDGLDRCPATARGDVVGRDGCAGSR